MENTKKAVQLCGFFGALQGIRTPDLLVRRQTLYPAELAAHIFDCLSILSQKRFSVKCFSKEDTRKTLSKVFIIKPSKASSQLKTAYTLKVTGDSSFKLLSSN